MKKDRERIRLDTKRAILIKRRHAMRAAYWRQQWRKLLWEEAQYLTRGFGLKVEEESL